MEENTNPFKGEIWKGVFKSFAEADSKSQTDRNVWDNDIWLEKQISQYKDSLKKLNSGKNVAELAETKEYCLPVLMSSISTNDHLLRVLDFGGGLGSTYLYVLSTLTADIKFEFCIIENEEICKYGNEFFKNDSRIKFLREIPFQQKFDVIHLGSSFHYVEDWLLLLDSFAEIKPSFLVFADLPAGDIDTFITTQYYWGKKIPVRFWNLFEFIQEVEKRPFQLVFKSRLYNKYMQAMDVFDEKHRLNHFSQLIFRLKQ